MTKRSVLVVATFLGFWCSKVDAQQTDHPLSFRSLHPFSSYLTSLDRPTAQAFPFSSGFGSSVMAQNDFLPNWRPTGWDSEGVNLTFGTAYPQQRQTRPVGSAMPYAEDSSKESPPEMQKGLFDYVHGEIGFFYGRSSGGRNSLDTEGGYLFGETGNEHFSIGAGVYYQNSNFQYSRRSR